MKTILLVLLLSVAPLIALCQNDFRNVNWGMTIDEVKKAETAPLTKEGKQFVGLIDGKEQYDGMELVYDEVTVAGNKATLYYVFENGRLTQSRVVYKYSFYLKVEDQISTKILAFKPLYDALAAKGFKSRFGFLCEERFGDVDWSYKDNLKLVEMPLDGAETGDLIERLTAEKKCTTILFLASNQRTSGTLRFPTKYDDAVRFYVAVLKLSPSLDVKKKIDSSDF